MSIVQSVQTPIEADHRAFTLDDVIQIGQNTQALLEHIRSQLSRPNNEKTPPVFMAGQLAKLCEIDQTTVSRKVNNPDDPLPKGRSVNPARREFTLAEVREWLKVYKPPFKRDHIHKGAVIAITSHKGGVGKSSLTLHLAHALSLKGYNVLTIDCDPQATLTSAMGINPDLDVNSESTLLPLAQGATDSLLGSIRPTYWDGVSIVPSSIAMNEAEFYLPTRQARDPRFQFYNVLGNALAKDQLLDTYDYVLIDTPPSLNYITINAIWAANALLSPICPEGPDFASSGQFWSLLGELMRTLDANAAQQDPERLTKTWDWIRVVPSLVNHTRASTDPVLNWMTMAYGAQRIISEIPESSSVSNAGAKFGSIYDMTKYAGSQQTYARARDAYDKIADTVDELTRKRSWGIPLTEAKPMKKVRA